VPPLDLQTVIDFEPHTATIRTTVPLSPLWVALISPVRL
jgi:hypothetical protein